MAAESARAVPVVEVTCPQCWQRTDRIQAYTVTIMLCLLIYIVWNEENVAGCPACVRKRLWRRFLLGIPMMNILFPFFAPFILLNILHSHSTDRPGIPPEYHGWADLTPPQLATPFSKRGGVIRVLVTLIILAAVLAFAVFVLPLLGSVGPRGVSGR